MVFLPCLICGGKRDSRRCSQPICHEHQKTWFLESDA
ncbi:hypothetical protein FOCG_18402 [Fusarium oxysporum f. sp. radicis-lycopersici 26381]|nr:hypothetical protein FOCG_18402 [Fusarium oxysporum f. sp. radicis-lycopersici 26381]